MRIASCTNGFRELSIDKTLTTLEELGIQYVECTLEKKAHLYPFAFGEKPPEQLLEILSRHKIRLVAISGGYCDFGVPDASLESEYDSLRKQIWLCRCLDVPILRIFVSNIPADQLDDVTIKRIIRNIKQIVPEAETNHVCLVIENYRGITSDLNEMLQLLERVSSPFFKAVFDTANFVPFMQDPVEACKVLMPYIAHVHLKDALFTGQETHSGYSYCEIGAGCIDFPSILSTLAESKYEGVLSIEYENTSDVARGTRISHENLKALLSKLPGNF